MSTNFTKLHEHVIVGQWQIIQDFIRDNLCLFVEDIGLRVSFHSCPFSVIRGR